MAVEWWACQGWRSRLSITSGSRSVISSFHTEMAAGVRYSQGIPMWELRFEIRSVQR